MGCNTLILLIFLPTLPGADSPGFSWRPTAGIWLISVQCVTNFSFFLKHFKKQQVALVLPSILLWGGVKMDVVGESNLLGNGNGGNHLEGYTRKCGFGFVELWLEDRKIKERRREKPAGVIIIMGVISKNLGHWEMHRALRLPSGLLSPFSRALLKRVGFTSEWDFAFWG